MVLCLSRSATRAEVWSAASRATTVRRPRWSRRRSPSNGCRASSHRRAMSGTTALCGTCAILHPPPRAMATALPLSPAREPLPRFEPPTRNVGHNRFVWDLRYPPPPAARYGYSIAAIAGQGTVAEPQGPLVFPGAYEVRLGVGGQTYSRSLRIELDPRVHVADSGLVAQLRLGLDIWNAMAGQHALAGSLRSARDQISALAARSLDRATRASLTALQGQVDSLARAVDGAGDELAGLEAAVE